MRRVYLTVLLSFMFILPTFAQYYQGNNGNRGYYGPRYPRSNRYGGETYYGLRLGWAIATVNSDDERLNGGESLSGLNLGFVIGTQLSPSAPLFLEGGLFYTGKGGQGRFNNKKFTYDLNYLELPIIIKYKYYATDQVAIQPFLGGFFACGISGKIKDYGEKQAESSFSDNNFKRFDGGIRIGCGVSFQNIYADLTYDIGLANISHDTFDSSHTRCFYLNIGVDF